MIDHLGIAVRDHAESKAFYLAALAPLGIGVQMNVSKEESGAPSDYTGFGANGKPFFWIGEGPIATGMHLASERREPRGGVPHAVSLRA